MSAPEPLLLLDFNACFLKEICIPRRRSGRRRAYMRIYTGRRSRGEAARFAYEAIGADAHQHAQFSRSTSLVKRMEPPIRTAFGSIPWE